MLLCRQGHGDNSTTHTPSGTYNPIFCSREPTVAVELKPQNALQTFLAPPHHAVNMSLVRICLLLFLYRPDQDLTVPSFYSSEAYQWLCFTRSSRSACSDTTRRHWLLAHPSLPCSMVPLWSFRHYPLKLRS